MKYIFLLVIGLNFFTSVAKAQVDPWERKTYYAGQSEVGMENTQCYSICAGLAHYLCVAPSTAEVDREQLRVVIEATKEQVRAMNGPGETDCCKELLNLQPDFSKKPTTGGTNIDPASLAQDLANLGISGEDLLAAGAVVGGLLLLNELANMIPIRMEPKAMKDFKKGNFSYHGLNGDVPYLKIKGKFTDDGFTIADASENSQFQNEDVIKTINGHDVKLWDDLYLKLLKSSGKEAEITIIRDNKKLNQTVQVMRPEFEDQSTSMPYKIPNRGTIVFPTGAIFYGRLEQGYPREGTIIYKSGITYTGVFRLDSGEKGQLANYGGRNHIPEFGYFDYPSLGIRRYFNSWNKADNNMSLAYKFSNGDSVKVIFPRVYGKTTVVHITADGKRFESDYIPFEDHFITYAGTIFSKFHKRLPSLEVQWQFMTICFVEFDVKFYRNYTFGVKLDRSTNNYLQKEKNMQLMFSGLDESNPLNDKYLEILTRINSLTYETKKQ